MIEDWYEIVQANERLTQGDLILNCPLIAWKAELLQVPHYVYSVPRSFLESLLKQRMQSRLRLLPPYREHLSQAFARFFMRVGLPVPIALTSF